MALSKNFKPATWRGTTSTDGEVVGVSFDLPSGETIRLALNAHCACWLADSLNDALNQRGTNVQSTRSSGSPSTDVSTHRECEKV